VAASAARTPWPRVRQRDEALSPFEHSPHGS